jgi:hypothetical protein
LAAKANSQQVSDYVQDRPGTVAGVGTPPL